jgi:hypothetical protein
VRAAVLTLAISLLAAAGAGGFYEPFSVRGDLDGDGAREEALTVKVPDPQNPNDDIAARTEVHVKDACPGGERRSRVAGPQDSLAFLRLYRADTKPGREVYVELRSGAAGRAGEAHLVRWRNCAGPRDLFRYTSERPTRRPRDAVSFGNFAIFVRQLERRFAGREIRLDESFLKRGDGACCPSIVKRTWFRYDRRSDRYERYRIRVIRR